MHSAFQAIHLDRLTELRILILFFRVKLNVKDRITGYMSLLGTLR